MLLNELPIGSKAEIKAFHPCSPEYRQRLMMLGVTPGAQLEVIRVAPLGDPIEIRVRNTLISVRKGEIKVLEVTPIL